MSSRTTAVWIRAVVALLVVVGVGGALGRTLFPDDFITRMEPVRSWTFDRFGRADPFAAGRAAELAAVDGKFAAHPLLTRVHVVFGAAFLLFAPLQFSARIRARNIRLHRWSGRILLPLAIVSVIVSLYFGILIPYGGVAEAIGIALFGALFIVSAARAFAAIRRKEIAQHREWMIRTFAIALAISTVRVLGGPFDLVLTPAGFRPPAIFVITIWTGWVITVGAAELWIRYTRAHTFPRGNLPVQTAVTIQEYAAKINAVTREDLVRVAKKYIETDNLNIIIVGDRAVVEGPLRKTGIGPIVLLDIDGKPVIIP